MASSTVKASIMQKEVTLTFNANGWTDAQSRNMLGIPNNANIVGVDGHSSWIFSRLSPGGYRFLSLTGEGGNIIPNKGEYTFVIFYTT